MRTLLRQREEIMTSFDFDKVQRTMAFLGWKWGRTESTDGIPTLAEVQKAARTLLDDVINYYHRHFHDVSESSGGFVAEVFNNELRLSFVLEYFPEPGCGVPEDDDID